MTNSTRDFLAIEFPGATPAEAAILAQECAAKLRDAGIAPASIQIARTDQEAMDLGGLLLVLAPLGYAFLEGAVKGAGGEAGKAIYEKIKAALGTLSRRHRTPIQIKGADGIAGTIGNEFQTASPSGKAGAGLGKLGIVLLGASEFPHMNDPTLNNPAFGRSASLAKKLFSPPHTAFAKTEVLDLFDKDMQPVGVLDAIEKHIDAHPDMHDLLVYYCGHGSFQKDKTYYLLLRSTRVGRESVTGFAPRTFRQDLEPRLIDKRVYFVVDCCFSGAFVDSLQSGSLESTVEEQLSLDMPRRGWTVLTASAKDKVAMAPKGETYTMFTGALAHVIEGGTAAAGVRFNLLDLTDAARTYVTGAWQRQAVMPQCISPRQTEGDIARLPIFLNKHGAQAKSEPSGSHLPRASGISQPKPQQAGPAEREWHVLGLETCADPGLLLAYAAKWEKQDLVWAYRARKAAEALEAGRKQQEAEKDGTAEAPVPRGGGWLDKAKAFVTGPAGGQPSAAPAAPSSREQAAVARPAWASGAGSDKYGRWADFALGDVRQRMRWIEPGSFTMGSPKGEAGRYDDEGPQHEVRLTKGFWLGDTQVTQALWTAAIGSNPSSFEGPERPVESVSWDDAQEFLKKMNARIPGLGLGLPTKAQWEYACRAGTTDANYARGAQELADVAWFADNRGGETHPVATKPCNDWGLHDMIGNVWEWCADGKRSYTAKPAPDPAGPLRIAKQAWQVRRHGHGRSRSVWENSRVYFRGMYVYIGFRCCA